MPELLQIIDKTRYANSYINNVFVNKGVQAATKVLTFGSDENGVFGYDEATYYLLGPVLKRYPNSFKDGGNLSNTNAVVCALLHIGVLRLAPKELGHRYIDNPEGLYMLRSIANWIAHQNKDGTPKRSKRYHIPEWLFLENHHRPTLPDSTGRLKDRAGRMARSRGFIWKKE